jgi:hypothetical protein
VLSRRVTVAACLASLAGLTGLAPAAQAASPDRASAASPASAASLARADSVSAAAARRPGVAPGSARQLLKDLRAAWQITRGQGVTVAIVGGGVDPSAGGLSGKVTTGPSFGPAGQNQAVIATVLADAVAGSGPSAGNPYGTIGLAAGARILSLPISVTAARSSDSQRYQAQAIRYAARRGARVIVAGLTGSTDTVDLDKAVDYAISRDAVVISPEFRGTQRNAAEYPSSLPGVLGAASIVLPGLQAPPRQYKSPASQSILIAAPGNVIAVSGPAGAGYQIYNLLSAAAWLTSTVALIKAVFPHLAPAMVARAIAVSARDHPPGGYQTKLGFGLINPVGAVRAAARLAHLPQAARPGPGAADPAARFVPGPAPGPVHAVRHSLAKLAGYGGAVLAGVILIALAPVACRRRAGRRVSLAA